MENVERFKCIDKIHLYEGDSGEVLGKMIHDIPEISEGVLFWLAGHYSGGETARADLDTPIMKELDTIFRLVYEKCVILIDDAVEFKGKNGYPTIDGLQQYVLSKRPNCKWYVKDNIIRIVIE